MEGDGEWNGRGRTINQQAEKKKGDLEAVKRPRTKLWQNLDC